jgi:hypothetical protein
VVPGAFSENNFHIGILGCMDAYGPHGIYTVFLYS